jgi:uncharacterized membrane protein
MARKIIFLFTFLLMQLCLLAQTSNVQMADTLRSNGKIYVVVAVIITIFAGITLYLIRLDRKLTKFEKNHYNS